MIGSIIYLMGGTMRVKKPHLSGTLEVKQISLKWYNEGEKK